MRTLDVGLGARAYPIHIGRGALARAGGLLQSSASRRAVIGGIYEEVITNDTTKVPFLGDVPVVGWLFKNTGRSSQKTELLIFLTPRVVRDTVTSVR